MSPTQMSVAPLAGAWVEILGIVEYGVFDYVAPLAGAWVEILVKSDIQKLIDVAPLAGAWVEILIEFSPLVKRRRRSPRGGVG